VESVGCENADLSSESPDENSGCRKFKVSSAMSIIRGLGGTNPAIAWWTEMYKRLIFRFQAVIVIT